MTLRAIRAAVVVALAAAASAAGDERKIVDVVCPIDGFKFKAVQVTNVDHWGGVDTDFCRHSIKTTPIEFYAWTCPQCFYSGTKTAKDDDFAPERSALKDKVLGKLQPLTRILKGFKQEQIPGYVKYDLVAQVAALSGAPPLDAGRAWLSASWCVRQQGTVYLDGFDEWETVRERYGLNRTPFDLGKRNRTEVDLEAAAKMEKEVADGKWRGLTLTLTKYTLVYVLRRHGENVRALRWIEDLTKQKGENSVIDDALAATAASIELERTFQRKAAEKIAAALQDPSMEARVRGELEYMMGELCRRLGDDKKAAEWFDQSSATTPDEAMKKLAAQQRALLP